MDAFTVVFDWGFSVRSHHFGLNQTFCSMPGHFLTKVSILHSFLSLLTNFLLASYAGCSFIFVSASLFSSNLLYSFLTKFFHRLTTNAIDGFLPAVLTWSPIVTNARSSMDSLGLATLSAFVSLEVSSSLLFKLISSSYGSSFLCQSFKYSL